MDEIATDKKRPQRKSLAMSDDDDDYGRSDKKLLLGSDFNMKIPTPAALKEHQADDLGGEENNESMMTMESIDQYVGPVKEEFNNLKRMIDEKD